MQNLFSRRRFIALSAMALANPSLASPLTVIKSQALGAQVTLRLSHPQAQEIGARALAEIARLEAVFSLYQPRSALSTLNAQGQLVAPPFELLDCLSLAATVHRASLGRFDPSVQPLWALHAEAASRNTKPSQTEIAQAKMLVGFEKIRLESGAITLPQGMQLTLNGIAQGYIADQIARLLTAEGLDHVLIDTGELRVLGPQAEGKPWSVNLAAGGQHKLASGALATSAPLGTCFDQAQTQGHILDPQTGQPCRSAWRSVSIAAPSAALADALSTASCLTKSKQEIERLCAGFAGAQLVAATPA